MHGQRERTLELINQLRRNLDLMEKGLRSGSVADKNLAQVESMLVDRQWRPNFMGLTGPGGYDPQPVYEKCGTCGHYRMR